jgi:hypothetical protein
MPMDTLKAVSDTQEHKLIWSMEENSEPSNTTMNFANIIAPDTNKAYLSVYDLSLLKNYRWFGRELSSCRLNNNKQNK